jgi:hypothetical protein
MSSEDECENYSDGLECFQFTLLLDDVSSTRQKYRKLSAEEYLREYEGSRGCKESKEICSDRSGTRVEEAERKNSMAFNEQPWIGLHSETKSECPPEPKQCFKLWGSHRTCKALASHFQDKKPQVVMSAVKARRDDDSGESSSPEVVKKKSLRNSKREEFHPRESPHSSHRKLSYQDPPVTDPTLGFLPDQLLDIRARLNLDRITMCGPFGLSPVDTPSMKLSQYVHDDLQSLMGLLKQRLEKELESRDSQEFPDFNTVLSSR